jgi:predicted RNA-binding protein YlqC (UPF0109 family)
LSTSNTYTSILKHTDYTFAQSTAQVKSTASTLRKVVNHLVSRPDCVTVECLFGNGTITILLTVHASDFIKVTGPDGRTARSLRAVVDAIASTSDEQVQLAIEAVDQAPDQAPTQATG